MKSIKAWAKINLTLDVLGKRPDNYHQLASVMQAVGIYDTLVINKTDRQGIELKTNITNLPTDEGNLVYKAAKLLTWEYNVKEGISIELRKNIPIGAGLAGGSSDCAAALYGINELLDLKIPQKRLLELGSQLGSDVPFCLMSIAGPQSNKPFTGTALVEGAGEKITPLPAHPDVSIVLACPPIVVSTQKIFARWSNTQTEGQTPAMVNAITEYDVKKIAANLANDLTPIATGLHPEILELISAFRAESALGVNMTGSGGCVFAYFSTEADALAAIKNMGAQFSDCELYFAQPLKIN